MVFINASGLEVFFFPNIVEILNVFARLYDRWVGHGADAVEADFLEGSIDFVGEGLFHWQWQVEVEKA